MVLYIRSIDYLFLHFFVLDFAIVLILCVRGGVCVEEGYGRLK